MPPPPPKIRVDKGFFRTREEVEADVVRSGFKQRPFTSPCEPPHPAPRTTPPHPRPALSTETPVAFRVTDKELPVPVRENITEPLVAKHHEYEGGKKVIHVVGPDLRDWKVSRSDARLDTRFVFSLS